VLYQPLDHPGGRELLNQREPVIAEVESDEDQRHRSAAHTDWLADPEVLLI
jgi:hypothetical protein